MSPETLTSAERLGRTISHQEGDRVPFFLGLTMHPAELLGLSLRDYFHSVEAPVEGQLEARALLGHDAVMSFLNAPSEIEAFGGEVIFHHDAPPNAGPPPLRGSALERLEVPDPTAIASLARVLEITRRLAARVDGRALVLGSLVGPLSLPVLQLGFETYLDLLHDAPHLIDRLWRVNAEFCARWANAQLAAGASMVVFAEPLSSPSLLPLDRLAIRGVEVLRATTTQLRGPFGISLASAPIGRMLPHLLELGTAAVGPSHLEDLRAVKVASRGRAVVMGGLNGLQLCTATRAEAERMVKQAIAAAGAGGGFVLSEHHGEVPFPVPWDTLHAVADAVRRWGRYPLCQELDEV